MEQTVSSAPLEFPREVIVESRGDDFHRHPNSQASVALVVADTQECAEQVAAEPHVVGAQPQNQERFEQHVDPKAMEQTVSSAPLEFPREVMVVDDRSSCGNASFFENLQLKEEIRQLKEELRQLKEELRQLNERNRSDVARVLQDAHSRFEAATSVLKIQLRESEAARTAAEMQSASRTAAEMQSGQASQLEEISAMRSEIDNLRAHLKAALSQAEQAKSMNRDLVAALAAVKSENHDLAAASRTAAEMQSGQASQLEEISAMRSEIDNLRAHLKAALSQAEQAKSTNRDLAAALAAVKSENHDLAAENAAVKQKTQLSDNAMQFMRVQACRDSAESGRLRAEAEKFCMEASNSSRDRDRLAAECESMRQELFHAKESGRQLQDQHRRQSEELYAAQQQLLAVQRAPPQRASGGAAAAAVAAAPVPSPSASATPASRRIEWLRVAETVGQPQPSSADVEKFERCLSVLRCMSLNTGDDAVRCIIVNNGDVPAVVDQMLALSA
jgi:hypothetical protein